MELVKAEIAAIEETPIPLTLVVGEPIKTHENVTNLEARWVVWQIVRDILTGDWSYFEEELDEVDDESVRH